MSSKGLCVVTGAGGYVGSHVVKVLLEAGYAVNGTVRSLKDSSKTQFLTDLPHANDKVSLGGLDRSRLELFAADLEKDASFDECMKGAEFVFHVASPYSLSVQNPQKDLVDPAVNGTKNVLASVLKAKDSVKRVVVTSSCAAVTDEPIDGHNYNEDDWNTLSSLSRNPYYYSKVLAEKFAWKWQADTGISLVTVNPHAVIGPSMTSIVNPSVSIFKGLYEGEFPALLDLSFCFVDVRDVAQMHLIAAFSPNASGRYICAAQTLTLTAICNSLRRDFPQTANKLPSMSMTGAGGSFFAKMYSYFQSGQKGDFVRCNIAKHPVYDNSKSKNAGLQYRNVEASIRETVDDLIRWKHIAGVAPGEGASATPSSSASSSAPSGSAPSS